MVSIKDSRERLHNAICSLGIEEGKECGLYAPLARRHKLYVDDAVPQVTHDNLVENNTCACTNSHEVYVDTELALEMFKKAHEALYNDDELHGYMVEDDYITILAHEYTHILMQHVEKGIKFRKANGDANYPIFAYACDIEANRGYRIRTMSDVYGIAVTEDSFPETKGVNGLMHIYRVLKENYGDEILEAVAQARKEKEGKEKQSKSKSKSEDGSSGSSSPQTEREKRAEIIKRNISSIDVLKEQMDKREKSMTQTELNEDLKLYDEKTVEELPTEFSVPQSANKVEGLYDGSPQQALEAQFTRANEVEFNKALEKLKGVVKGSQVRTRVKTYSRQSRKSSDELIRKGVKQAKVLAPRVLVAMDSSGSMQATEVLPVASAIGTLAKMLGKTKGSYICEHDAYVKNVLPLSQWEKVVAGYCPRGDNDFDEVLRKALELKVEVVLNVGDGYANLFDKELMKQAKQRNMKWIDVEVCGDNDTLQRVVDEDAYRHGDNFIGREIISLCQV